jgi:hypothetical protein
LIFLGVCAGWDEEKWRAGAGNSTDVVGLLFALLGSPAETEDQVEGGLFLDIVVTEGATVLELLPSENETLLVGWDAGEGDGEEMRKRTV